MYELGWFSTGRDAAARELLQATQSHIASGDIKARIVFVFCNREPGESPESDLFLALAKSLGIPAICFSDRKFRGGEVITPASRLAYDREVMKRLASYHADLCVLAGYMLIVGPEMCRRYNMVNLHPAAPGGPAGTWQEVIWQIMEQKSPATGVMMHMVTPDLDKGPPVTYCTFSIRGETFDPCWRGIEGRSIVEVKAREGENNCLFQLIRKHGLAREFPLIIYTIQAFSNGQVRVTPDKKVVDTGGELINGYDLTREINAQVKDLL